MILIELVMGLLFVLSSGIFFNNRFRRNRVVVAIAGLFAIVSSASLLNAMRHRVSGAPKGGNAAESPWLDRQGLALLAQRQDEQAAGYFRRAVELDPRRAEYKDHLAFELIRLGRPAEAVTLLQEAIRMDRKYDLSYSHLSDARLVMGDTAGAVVALRQFLRVSTNEDDRVIALQRLDQLTAPLGTPP